MAPRLKEKYDNEVRDQLKDELGLDNVMQVPRLQKIVLNMGAGDAAADAKLINGVVEDLRTISGQQPKVNRARKSVSNFKLREG
ncbi:MAG: 50S ribosomal protein L5, partial [Acidimicrobiia bacterium]